MCKYCEMITISLVNSKHHTWLQTFEKHCFRHSHIIPAAILLSLLCQLSHLEYYHNLSLSAFSVSHLQMPLLYPDRSSHNKFDHVSFLLKANQRLPIALRVRPLLTTRLPQLCLICAPYLPCFGQLGLLSVLSCLSFLPHTYLFSCNMFSLQSFSIFVDVLKPPHYHAMIHLTTNFLQRTSLAWFHAH